MTLRHSVRSRRRRALQLVPGVAVVLAMAAPLAGCGSSDDSSVPQTADLPDHPTLLLTPDIDDSTRVTQLGTAPVTVSWSSLEGGRAMPTSGPLGTRGWKMPGFTTAEPYPRVAMVVQSSDDALSPGTRPFSWGADFVLNAESVAPTGPDNGDNLLQRGLWGQSAEFKAEVDLRRASCVVHGTEGTLLIRADMDAKPDTWYRMRCYRGPEGLTVTVRALEADGWGPEVEAHTSGLVGDVSYPASMPIAIGGKAAPNGQLVSSATDQFNGLIANPVVEIGAGS